jgi:hypothetical protein
MGIIFVNSTQNSERCLGLPGKISLYVTQPHMKSRAWASRTLSKAVIVTGIGTEPVPLGPMTKFFLSPSGKSKFSSKPRASCGLES